MAEAKPAQPFYQIYRGSSLGKALFESLDELIQSGHINPQLAVKVLTQFDKTTSLALAAQSKSKCSAKSHLNTFNLVDDVWTFQLQNPTFKFENNAETVVVPGKCKIVACKAGSLETK
ncbi:transcription initiation factor TFIIA small subunit, partial [Phenoliferia sp. Uapishka_3]